MKTLFFSTQSYEEPFFHQANRGRHELVFSPHALDRHSSQQAKGYPAVCAFVNDTLDAATLDGLHQQGVKLIALRCAGYNNVDLVHAKTLGLTVARVPSYSPHAVAEHAVGLILALNRHIHRAYHRVRELDFSLHGLMGFDLVNKTVGVIGTGQIGTVFAHIMNGFGCHVLACDPVPNDEIASLVNYVTLPELFAQSDLISLHCPLTPETNYLINGDALAQMKQGVMLINTSRGALINTRAVIIGLKSGQIGSLGIDVYEEEAKLFFEDQSDRIVQDDVLTRLLTFPNVIVTGHQAYFTKEALQNIAETTLTTISAFENGYDTLYKVEA